MLRKRVLGSHKKQIDTIKNWFPSDEQGLVEDLIERMVTDPNSPMRAYGGGHRSNVTLTDYEAAKEFAKERGRDTEWL